MEPGTDSSSTPTPMDSGGLLGRLEDTCGLAPGSDSNRSTTPMQPIPNPDPNNNCCSSNRVPEASGSLNHNRPAIRSNYWITSAPSPCLPTSKDNSLPKTTGKDTRPSLHGTPAQWPHPPPASTSPNHCCRTANKLASHSNTLPCTSDSEPFDPSPPNNSTNTSCTPNGANSLRTPHQRSRRSDTTGTVSSPSVRPSSEHSKPPPPTARSNPFRDTPTCSSVPDTQFKHSMLC